ncbi:hypothetical protein MWU76_06225 [Gelidibacter sp. F2691]|nr:hypothetical protein [Gelidibacter sp. F2691]
MLLILSIFFFITSCSEEEDEKQQSTSIYNQWDMIKYEPGLSPTENFSKGQVSWNFEKTNSLKVQIDKTISNPPLKNEGTYEFSINGDRISIDNIEYDFSINQKTLTISDDPASDGFKITFAKKNE